MRATFAPSIRWILTNFVVACALAPRAPPASAEPVRLNVSIDARRTELAAQTMSVEGRLPSYTYGLKSQGDALELRLDAPDLMRRWTGSVTLGEDIEDDFESELQFAPVLLVVSVINDGDTPLQVTDAYLDVRASTPDLRPFLYVQPWSYGASTTVDICNYGWGPAEKAMLTFGFANEGDSERRTKEFTLALGDLGCVAARPIDALTALSPAVPALQKVSPKCPSEELVEECLTQLGATADLGGLKSFTFVEGKSVITRVMGTLSHGWKDAMGREHDRQVPLVADVVVFGFDVPFVGAEEGAPEPVGAGFSPVMLSADRKDYRIPLPDRPLLEPAQEQRLELTLAADKASSHLFRIVMETTGGGRIESLAIDLLYFVPHFPEEAEPAEGPKPGEE